MEELAAGYAERLLVSMHLSSIYIPLLHFDGCGDVPAWH